MGFSGGRGGGDQCEGGFPSPTWTLMLTLATSLREMAEEATPFIIIFWLLQCVSVCVGERGSVSQIPIKLSLQASVCVCLYVTSLLSVHYL